VCSGLGRIIIVCFVVERVVLVSAGKKSNVSIIDIVVLFQIPGLSSAEVVACN